MYSVMQLKVSLPCKMLVTMLTLKEFLTCVYSNMLLKVVGFGKTLTAVFASKRFLSNVFCLCLFRVIVLSFCSKIHT